LVNLLQIITELELGGAQSVTLSILKNLDHSKFKTHLFSSPKGLLVEDAKKLKNTSIYLTPLLKRDINSILDIITFINIIVYIIKNDIDIVHTHSSKAGILGRWAAKLAKVPVIIHTYHGFGFNIKQRWITRSIFIFLECLTAKISHKLIFVSKSNKDTARKLGIGDENKNVIISEGIEKNKFLTSEKKVSKFKEKWGFGKESKVVGMIAPLKPQKSPCSYVKIAKEVHKRLQSVQFFLIGDGYLRKDVEKLVSDLELNERFFLLGWRKDINRILPIFDVLVLTSYWEGLPHVLLEAMFCSKPVVAYGVDGNCDIVKDGKNGFIITPGEIISFADKICKLLKDDNLAEFMGNNGYKFVKDKFNIDGVVHKTEKLYLDSLIT